MATTVEPPFNDFIKAATSFFISVSRAIATVCFCGCIDSKRSKKLSNRNKLKVVLANASSARFSNDPYNIFHNVNGVFDTERYDDDGNNELEMLLNASNENINPSYNSMGVADNRSLVSTQSVDSKLAFPQNFLKIFDFNLKNWYTGKNRTNCQQLYSIHRPSQRSYTSVSGSVTDNSSMSSRAFILEGVPETAIKDNHLVEDLNLEGLMASNDGQKSVSDF